MEKMGKKIIIAERDNIAAIMEGKKVQEFFVNRGEVLLGDIYLATVENILPSIEAAFVDVGVDKMGFLHAQDVIGKGALKDKLSPKQKIVVQVVKEPTGHKGPRVTTEISLPGRFLVLIPNETGINVSRKIESVKEKARLKSIVNLIKPVGVGVIIRTEAEGQSEADIQEDLEVLLEKWNNIVTSGDTLEAPSLISRDQDLLYRVLREACTDDIAEIVVDTAFAMNRVQQLLQNWHMNRNIDITLYKGTEPLLIATDVHKEIKTALQTKVNMPSGGYLFIQTTEALTVVDVNSGKFTSSATQDETILRTNKEAVQEIARQLRLRNIGGMIIIDFIDMTSRVDKLAIMEEFELAIEHDKAKPQIGQLSDLGLVELTRHRQGQSLSELFTKKCPHCQGNGYVMEDFKFAAPTAEGEYRAKASKLKMPVSNFKKNENRGNDNRGNDNRGGGNFNQHSQPQPQNQPQLQPQPQMQQEEKTEFSPENAENQVNPQDNRSRNKNKRNNKFNRNKGRDRFQNETQEQQGVAPSQSEGVENVSQPVIAPVEPIAVPPSVSEVKVEQKLEQKKESVTESKVEPVVDKKEKKSVEPEIAQAEEKSDDKETKDVKEVKPKKVTRRPNRNTSKKPKKADAEVNDEEPTEKS